MDHGCANASEWGVYAEHAMDKNTLEQCTETAQEESKFGSSRAYMPNVVAISIENGSPNMKAEQTQNEDDSASNSSDIGVVGMPLDLSLNHAGVEINSGAKASKLETGFEDTSEANLENSLVTSGVDSRETLQILSVEEPTDDTYQAGMPLVSGVYRTRMVGLEVVIRTEASELDGDTVCTSGPNFENSFTNSGSLEQTKSAQSLSIGETIDDGFCNGGNVMPFDLRVDKAGGEHDSEHVSTGGFDMDCFLDPISELNVQKSLTSVGSYENIDAARCSKEDVVEYVRPDETGVVGTEFDLNHAIEGAFEQMGTAQSSSEEESGTSIFNSGSEAVILLDSTLDKAGDAGLGSDVDCSDTDPLKLVGVEYALNLSLESSEHIQEIQGFVEEGTANGSSHNCGPEMVLQLRMDKVEDEVNMGHDSAKKAGRLVIEMEGTSGSNDEISSGSLEHKERTQFLNQEESSCWSSEIHRAGLLLESRIDEGHIAENSLANAIEQETGPVLSGNSYTAVEWLQHFETTESANEEDVVLPSLKPETETHASNSGVFGHIGSAGILNPDDSMNSMYDNSRAGMPRDFMGNAKIHNHDETDLEAVASLLAQYETTLTENKDLLRRAIDSDTAHEVDMENLKALVVSREVELSHLHEQINLLTTELSKIREDGERKVQQAEQKFLGVCEKLSLAVTRGKGLVQQRDNLKQLLAEKTAEIEFLTSSYKQELQLKVVALHEAESKVKLYAEAVERVEAFKLELSYIRNSANTLRESFLQKDTVSQRIEELLEDTILPEELQLKNIFEKVEWLIEAYNQKNLIWEGQDHSQMVAVLAVDDLSGTESASQGQEIEELIRTYEDLLHKYRGMAEQSARLEQSLLERNLLIQRWEEVLDTIDMPTAVRSKEPEDRIEWLGRAVSDAHTYTDQLQLEMQSSQATIDALNCALQKLQEENHVISVELAAKNDELKMISMNLEDMTMKYSSSSKPSYQGSNETTMELPQAGLPDSQEREQDQEANQQMQFPCQNTDLEVLVANIHTMLGEVVQEDEVYSIFSGASVNTVLESSVKLLVKNCKLLSLEAADMKGKVEELFLALSVAEKEREQELQSLHEALSNSSLQIEVFIRKESVLEDEIDGLKNQVKAVTEEIFYVRDKLAKSQLEASQAEEKLATVREKLIMALKKGKSVVQHHDDVRQSLQVKTAGLNQMDKERQEESLALNKAGQSLKHLVQQVQMLEAELSSSREYAFSMERSLKESNRAFQKFSEALDKVSTLGAPCSGDTVENIQWLSQAVVDAQRKSEVIEQEAKKSKKAAELFALQLEEVQGRMDFLTDELMLTEKNISILTEEKKIAETAKTEAGLCLQHGMAKINSLLFELCESRQSQENLKRENLSLKDALSAQMEEIRYKETKSEEQFKDLADLCNKVHALKDYQAAFLSMVADEVFKLTKDTGDTKVSVIKLSDEVSSLKKQNINPLLTAQHAFVEDFPSKWQLEFSSCGGRSQDWKQGVTTGFLKLQCEEMEVELQRFGDIFRNFTAASTQDFVAISQLMLEISSGLGFILQKMESLESDANLARLFESLRIQKDKQIENLEVGFKAMVERVKSSVEELKVLKIQAQGQVPCSGSTTYESPEDVMFHMASKDLQTLVAALVEQLYSTVKDLAHLHKQERIENEKQNEDLRNQLGEAKAVIDAMDQQQQLDKLKISELQKSLEEFKVNEDSLKRTNLELYALRDVLSIKRHEEEGLVQALNKSETKIGKLSAKVEELEKTNQELVVSLGEASRRFSTTVIEEAKNLHLLLKARDAQISELREELNFKGSEVTSLQNLVDEKTAVLSQLHRQIREIVGKDVGDSELLAGAGSEREASNTKELLEMLVTSIQAGTEGLRIQLARKDALMQDVQVRHDELARKVTFLQASLQVNQRLKEETVHTNVAGHMATSMEVNEMGNRGKHIVPPAAVVTHGRGGRKVSSLDHLALNVDMEPSRSWVDLDDNEKGHVFKPLTSSRLVPCGTRFLVDRIDGFWVAGERLLMRKPEARLSVMLYWLVLHIWMVVLSV